MASIESLLNPAPEIARYSLPSPTLTSSTSTLSSRGPRQKKPKLTKDAPVFTRGKVRGEVRYPPCEDRDEELIKLHHEFEIHPLGSIAEYPRHIPYSSDKKTFQDRTGRGSFEVFQYTFKIPGEEKEWTVMWDYNIGLVRTTHLFRCNEYSKTTPAKMLNANPGLRDICHSITGGALAAQGYWMPFEAAKAVTATFCWKIRYALTPLFGTDFPSMCIHPSDRALFGRMIIDPAVVTKATDTANLYRMLELRSTPVSRPSTGCTSPAGATVPVSRVYRGPLIPKGAALHRRYPNSVGASSHGSASVSGAPADSLCVSPVGPSQRSAFKPVNAPRSSDVARVLPGISTLASSPQRMNSNSSTLASSAMPIPQKSDDDESDSMSLSTSYSDHTASPSVSGGDSTEDSDSMMSLDLDDADAGHLPRRRIQPSPETRTEPAVSNRIRPFAKEVKAAHALLSLYMQDATDADGDGDGDAQVDDAGGSAWKQKLRMKQKLKQRESGRKRRRASA